MKFTLLPHRKYSLNLARHTSQKDAKKQCNLILRQEFKHLARNHVNLDILDDLCKPREMCD